LGTSGALNKPRKVFSGRESKKNRKQEKEEEEERKKKKGRLTGSLTPGSFDFGLQSDSFFFHILLNWAFFGGGCLILFSPGFFLRCSFLLRRRSVLHLNFKRKPMLLVLLLIARIKVEFTDYDLLGLLRFVGVQQRENFLRTRDRPDRFPATLSGCVKLATRLQQQFRHLEVV